MLPCRPVMSSYYHTYYSNLKYSIPEQSLVAWNKASCWYHFRLYESGLQGLRIWRYFQINVRRSCLTVIDSKIEVKMFMLGIYLSEARNTKYQTVMEITPCVCDTAHSKIPKNLPTARVYEWHERATIGLFYL